MSKKNILIIHGFMHSKNRYYKLYKDLKTNNDINIDFYDFDGFGGVEPNSNKNKLNYYVEKLNDMLNQKKYNLIVAHSMGCNILLKSMSKYKNSVDNVILLSPCYYGIKKFKPLSLCIPLSNFLFFLQSNLPIFITKPFVKLVARVTVSDNKYVDNIMILDARKSDSYTCAKVFNELSFDNWKLNNTLNANFYIIQGVKDKVIDVKNVKLLKEKLKCPIYYRKNIGHTIVLEDYDYLLSFIRKVL